MSQIFLSTLFVKIASVMTFLVPMLEYAAIASKARFLTLSLVSFKSYKNAFTI
jgi:hypothetical protein